MKQISPHLLWVGNAGDGRDFRRILDAGIEAVVQVAIDEPVVALPRDLLYCRFPLVDAAGNNPHYLALAIRTLAALLAAKVPTLICCGGGLSRSPAIAAAALARTLGEPPDDYLVRVVQCIPHDVTPALWQDIKHALVLEESQAAG